jgi:hypothetical protein
VKQRKSLQIKSYLKVIKSLIAKGAILIFEEVKEKYAPKKETTIGWLPTGLSKGTWRN